VTDVQRIGSSNPRILGIPTVGLHRAEIRFKLQSSMKMQADRMKDERDSCQAFPGFLGYPS